MKEVQLMRAKILRCQQQALMGVKSYASMIEGNQQVVEKLSGDEGAQILADVTDFLLMRLGHKVTKSSKDVFSKTRRAARRLANG